MAAITTGTAHAAVAEAKTRKWKMNVAVVDSGGNLMAFQRMDGAMISSTDRRTQGACDRYVPALNRGLRGRNTAQKSQLR
ncbi:MAG: heme-binding protein [Candidatus Acidiferrales bacterium]